MKTGSLTNRINHQIKAPTVRALGADGKQVGVFSLSEALNYAGEKGLDVIEIAPSATPPVVKIMELGKFRYEQEKKLKKDKKAAKASELKEIRFSPFIAEHDYNVRMKRIREFLGDSNKVRVSIVFMGRQMDSKPIGYDLIRRITDELGETIVIDSQPKFYGRHLVTTISPVKKSRKVEAQESKSK